MNYSENIITNKDLILNKIFLNEVTSRTALAKELNLSKPTTNEYVDKLLATNVIVEAGEGESAVKGGRRPILITLNEKYRYIVALDLNYTNPVIALGNMSAFVIDRFQMKNYNYENIYSILKNNIYELITRNNILKNKIGAIVISSPGIVNNRTGNIITNPQFHNLRVINIKNHLQEEFGVTVIVKNDVNMAAVGETLYLKEKGKNILFVSCGLGLGTSFIINGELYEGENFAAGEIGYYINDENCESIENTLCIPWLISQIEKLNKEEKLSIDIKEAINFQMIVDLYNSGDTKIKNLVRDIGIKLGIVINNLVSIVDVNKVIIGGDYLAFQDDIIREINNIINKSPIYFKPTVEPTMLLYAGAIIGCFNTGINYVLKNITI